MDIETFEKANELQEELDKIDYFMEFLRSDASERHLKLQGKIGIETYTMDISMYDEALVEKLKQQGVVFDEEYHFYKSFGKELSEFLIPRLEQRAADLRTQFEQL